jgi:hypothetical protein
MTVYNAYYPPFQDAYVKIRDARKQNTPVTRVSGGIS